MSTAVLPSLKVPAKQQQEHQTLTQMQEAFATWSIPRELRQTSIGCQEVDFQSYA